MSNLFNPDEVYLKIVKGMFLDYTLDISKKWGFKNDDKISHKEATDFIDQWVNTHFSRYEEKIDASE